MSVKLHGPYLTHLTGPNRGLRYEPEHPDAQWWIASEPASPPPNSSYVTFSPDLCTLVRHRDDGAWDQAYAGHHTGRVRTTPFTREQLEGAELTLGRNRNGEVAINFLLQNQPLRERRTTGSPLAARPGVKCAKCGERDAIVTLSSYHNGKTTNNLVRHFCRECLSTGEPAPKSRICHICRQRGAELTIYTVKRHAAGYDFRIHAQCVATLDQRLHTRTPIAERRPLRLVVTA